MPVVDSFFLDTWHVPEPSVGTVDRVVNHDSTVLGFSVACDVRGETIGAL